MRTLRQVLHFSRRLLEKNHVVRPRQAAEEVLSEVLKLSRIELSLNYDRTIQVTEWQQCYELLKRRIAGEPIEYIQKLIEFFRCRIEVTPAALIPRQETEILLQKVCDLLKAEAAKPLVAWDVCCGTGCLGLGLKRFFPQFQVFLSDLSEDCVILTKRNAERNFLNVEVVQGDLLAPFTGQKADVILCNPPYISEDEYASLEKSVKNFEPKLALVGGKTGLEYYVRLAHDLPAHLNDGAWVFLELGHLQGSSLLDIFSAPHWETCLLSKDWAGHDRFLFLRFKQG